MNLEGLIIHKTAYKERDLICKLLTRSGKLADVYIYGGRGGGKKSKGSFLEIGHMIKITLNSSSSKKSSDIKVAKEYSLIWESKYIRLNHMAFYLVCFFCEVLQKVSVEEDYDDHKANEEFKGLFVILSNILFHMDKSLENKTFNLSKYLFMFLSKLLYEMGSLPHYDYCISCEQDLKKFDLAKFEPQDGGFICIDCLTQKDQFLSGNLELINELKINHNISTHLELFLKSKIAQINDLSQIDGLENKILFNYLCYQIGFNEGQFKTWEMIKTN
ncbi:MAG: DNA repair protein RecO [Bacteriovoracaceae bacterium]|jgi:recombinational DNA repair protein (RecF pathway)|nr:DNA repair protein RecO [Bacteriovoracaceae bacterium]